MRRRITIHSTKSRLLTVKGAAQEFSGWCEDCGKVVRMVSPDEAAAIAQASPRAIYRAIEAGEIHFLELPTLFVCRDSLFSRFYDLRERVEGTTPST